MSDVHVSREGYVTVLTVRRAPHNFFDQALVEDLARAGFAADDDVEARAIVLRSEGKNFCAGANFGEGTLGAERADSSRQLYRAAARLFEIKTPIVAAVQGAAVGGGLGLACLADFRVASRSSRLHANFARLGFHQGFGLSVTLPRIIGVQKASELLLTAAPVKGEQAFAIGLVDRLAPEGGEYDAAMALAQQIAANAPIAVRSIRETLRGELAEQVRAVLERELAEQTRHWQTSDCAEGIAANLERRDPAFTGETR